MSAKGMIQTVLATRLVEALTKDGVSYPTLQIVAGSGVSRLLGEVAEELANAHMAGTVLAEPFKSADEWLNEDLGQPGCVVGDAIAQMGPVEAARQGFAAGLYAQPLETAPTYKSADELRAPGSWKEEHRRMVEALDVDDRGLIFEAALQYGFTLLGDDARELKCTEAELVQMVTAARLQGRKDVAAPDACIEANRQLLLDRSRVGLRKYGETIEKGTDDPAYWLQHFIEELLDAANYAQKIKALYAEAPARACLRDVVSHYGDFSAAIQVRIDQAVTDGDRKYWEHQAVVLLRMKNQAAHVLAPREEVSERG